MFQRHFRVGLDIPAPIRSQLLQRFAPAFSTVQCKTLTHAYRVPETYPVPVGALQLAIYGYHRGAAADALLVKVNGQILRPDGNRYFIALSLAPGEQSVTAGDIDSDSVSVLKDEVPFGYRLAFQRFPLWNLDAVKKAA